MLILFDYVCEYKCIIKFRFVKKFNKNTIVISFD